MAVKRKSSPPPPQAQSSEEYSSSEEEEQEVAPVVSSQAKPPQRTEVDDDESETDSGSDSDPDPPAKPVILLHKPSKTEDSSDEDDDEEEEEEQKAEKPKLPSKKAESEPEKKKAKLSERYQPISEEPKLSASAVVRIWSKEDEMALLRALSEYRAKNGKLPLSKDCASLLSTISGSIGFPVTEKQLINKIRKMKSNYCQKKKKGSDVKISNPQDKALFDMCSKLFDDSIKGWEKGVRLESKKGVRLESNSDTDTENGGVAGVGEANGREANRGVAHGSAAIGDAQAKSSVYLRSFIEEMIREQRLPSWLKVEDVVARIGESRVQKMNAKIKMLRIDAMKLRAREGNIKAEFFATLGEVMADE